eukprot:scaffold92061_cov38-Tisochrysis_lutea.AAC.3
MGDRNLVLVGPTLYIVNQGIIERRWEPDWRGPGPAACQRKPHTPSPYVVHEGTSREAGGRSGKGRGRGPTGRA